MAEKQLICKLSRQKDQLRMIAENILRAKGYGYIKYSSSESLEKWPQTTEIVSESQSLSYSDIGLCLFIICSVLVLVLQHSGGSCLVWVSCLCLLLIWAEHSPKSLSHFSVISGSDCYDWLQLLKGRWGKEWGPRRTMFMETKGLLYTWNKYIQDKRETKLGG